MPRAAVAVRLCLLAAALALAAAAPPADAASRSYALALANHDRTRAGLLPIRLDPAPSRAAQAHARHMLFRRTVGHRLPGGRSLRGCVATAGSRWRLVSQNLAVCRPCEATTERLHQFQRGWMRSGHRRNLLDRRMRTFGFGFTTDGTTIFAVQVFGCRAPEAVAAGKGGELRPSIPILSPLREDLALVPSRPLAHSHALGRADVSRPFGPRRHRSRGAGLELVNEGRAEANLDPVEVDATLTRGRNRPC